MFIIAYGNVFYNGCFKVFFRSFYYLCHLTVGIDRWSFFIQDEIFLVLGMMSDFVLKSGHSECFVMRPWVLFKPSALVGFIWHFPSRRREMLPYDFRVGWTSNFPTWPLLTLDGERCSVLLLDSASPTSPLGLHWDPLAYSLTKVGVCTPHSAFAGIGSCRSLVTFDVAVVLLLLVCLFFLWCLAGVECLLFKIFLSC